VIFVVFQRLSEVGKSRPAVDETVDAAPVGTD
jgi:hypothetical protein